jgi:hypothetical protein
MTPLNFRRFFRDLTEFISEKELRLDRRARRELRGSLPAPTKRHCPAARDDVYLPIWRWPAAMADPRLMRALGGVKTPCPWMIGARAARTRQRHFILEIGEDRYRRGGALITSQIPVDR